MKKYISLMLFSAFIVCLLVGCGAKDVDSRDEANRILLSVSSVVAECESSMKEYDEDINRVKEKDLEYIEKRLNDCYADIMACNSYKDIEDVKPKYDSSMDKYERAVKHLEHLRSELEGKK